MNTWIWVGFAICGLVIVVLAWLVRRYAKRARSAELAEKVTNRLLRAALNESAKLRAEHDTRLIRRVMDGHRRTPTGGQP